MTDRDREVRFTKSVYPDHQDWNVPITLLVLLCESYGPSTTHESCTSGTDKERRREGTDSPTSGGNDDRRGTD